MSENVSIIENGKSVNFSPDKLEIDLQGSGTSNWVLKKDVNLESLTVTENGEYSAKEHNAYGFKDIFVNVIDSNPLSQYDIDLLDENPLELLNPENDFVSLDELGNLTLDCDYVIGLDPLEGSPILVIETPEGELKEIELPVNIDIDFEQGKNEYIDGESIDLDGASLVGYDKDGNEIGRIPISNVANVTLSASNADLDLCKDRTATSQAIGITYREITTEAVSQGNEHDPAAVYYVYKGNLGGGSTVCSGGVFNGKSSGVGAVTYYITMYNDPQYGLWMWIANPDTETRREKNNIDRAHPAGEGCYRLTGGTTARAGRGVFEQCTWEEWVNAPLSVSYPHNVDVNDSSFFWVEGTQTVFLNIDVFGFDYSTSFSFEVKVGITEE